jgi:type VI secretion system secreted protein VgrG
MADEEDLTTSRSARVTSPLGDGVLALESMQGHEGLGQTFVYELSLVSKDFGVDLSKLLGQPMTVRLDLEDDDDKPRYFNGIVTRASQLDGEEDLARYSVTLQPWLSLLDFTTDCRIFQDQSVPDIVKEVFRRADFSDFEESLSGTYGKLEYCVQYRESDFNFVSRLLEHAGIYYFFRHQEDKHTLVLADSIGPHKTVDGYEEIEYHPPRDTSRAESEHLSSWVVAQEMRVGGVSMTDYDFKLPRTGLLSTLNKPQNYAHAETELFEYPGDFLTKGEGDGRVKIRLEERQLEHEMVHASGDVRGLGCGDLFDLVNFPRDDQNKEYLVVTAIYTIHGGQYASSGHGGPEEFHSSLTLLDSQIPYRPPLRANKFRMDGPQTAMVVGPSGEEIWTDKYGRVMVQFHWDRYGMSDERSSCWVRVSQVWAGAKWGAIHIPRIGHEVVVDFLEGDPDRPLITGRVYNGDNMPPYDLPDNKTQSGIKSRSTKEGSPKNFNELRFEDKKGSEEVYLQAEKDYEILVKNDEHRIVGHDRTEEVKNDETITIDGNRTETVHKNELITIDGTRTETVSKDETITISGARTESVAKDETVSISGQRTLSVTKDDSTTVNGKQAVTVAKDQSVDIAGARVFSIAKDDSVSIGGKLTISIAKDETLQVGKKLVIDVADEIQIVTGDASISLKKDGSITLKGKDIVVDGSGKVSIKAGGDLVTKGSKVSQN